MSDEDEKKAVRGPGDAEGEAPAAFRTFLIADVRGYAAAFAASDWARSMTAAIVNVSCGALVD